MRYALIKDSIVSNVISWDGVSDYEIDGELVRRSGRFVDLGYIYQGDEFVKPDSPDDEEPA
jgi:hypothetical protein